MVGMLFLGCGAYVLLAQRGLRGRDMTKTETQPLGL